MKLTPAALALLQYEHVTDDDVVALAAQALEHPTDASFWDDDLYVTHTLMFHTPSWDLTSDYLDGEAQYRSALAELSERYPRDVADASIAHWTYSRYSCIKVRVLTPTGKVSAAFTAAVLLAKADDAEWYSETFWELQEEVWQAGVTDAIDTDKRDRDNDDLPARSDDDYARIAAYLSEHYGPGYSDPGWIAQEWWDLAVADLAVERQVDTLY